MKKYAVFFICCTTLISIISCKKNNTAPLNVSFYNKPLDSIKYYIQGKWKLFKQVGGIGGSTEYPENTYWEFANDEIFILSENNSIQIDTCIWKKKAISGTDSTYTITLKNGVTGLIYSFMDGISDNKLILHDGCCDGYYYYLIR